MTASAHAARRAIAVAALVCSAALVAACGSARSTSNGQVASEASAAQSSPAVSPSASASSSSPMPTSTAMGNTCGTADLKVTVVTADGGAAAGSVYYPLNFTNVSGSSCVLDGYPGTSFVTSPSGSQIGSPASKNPVVAPAPVTLAPGATGHATLQVVDAQNYSATTCDPVTAHWLRVYPPGQAAPAEVSFTTQVCSAQVAGSLGSSLTVDAIKAGQGKAGEAF